MKKQEILEAFRGYESTIKEIVGEAQKLDGRVRTFFQGTTQAELVNNFILSMNTKRREISRYIKNIQLKSESECEGMDLSQVFERMDCAVESFKSTLTSIRHRVGLY